MKIFQKKRKGFSLVETVLVTGLIAIFSLGVYVIYNKVRDSSIANDEAREMGGILAAARSLIGGTNYVPVFNAQLLADARIIQQARVSGLNYVSSTGKIITFAPVFTTGVSHLRITYIDTNITFCTKLASAYQTDVDLIDINGTIVKNTMPLQTPVNFEIPNVAAACAAGGDSFPMSFNFRR